MESLDYYSTSNTLNTFMTALFGAAAGVVAIICALIGIALYLLLAYAYYRMAKKRGPPPTPGPPDTYRAASPAGDAYRRRRVYFGSAKISNACSAAHRFYFGTGSRFYSDYRLPFYGVYTIYALQHTTGFTASMARPTRRWFS